MEVSGSYIDTDGTARAFKGQIVKQIKTTRTILQLEIEDDDYRTDGVFYSMPDGPYELRYEGKTARFDFLPFWGTTIAEDKLGDTIEQTIREDAEQRLKTNIEKYVKNGNDVNAKKEITKTIDLVWRTMDTETLVYRGQKRAQEIRTSPQSFFSTSKDATVATESTFFSYEEKCCLFVLHIQPGVKYYNVGSLSGGLLETEMLIEGNGKFYKDKGKTLLGFRQLTVQELLFKKNELNINSIYLEFFRSGKDLPKELQQTELQKKTGVFEAYYFPPATGGRKRRNTYRKKNRRRQTRRRI